MAIYRKSSFAAAATVFAFAAFGEYTNPLEITGSTVTSLTDAQKASLNANEYDALVFNNGGIVEVTDIGSFGGDIVIKSGSVMKGSGQACVGTAAGKTIVEDGGSFFYYRVEKSDLPASPNNEEYEIAGNGCGEYGALHFQYSQKAQSDQGKAVFNKVTLTAPAKMSSLNSNTDGRLTAVSTLDQNGHKLTCAFGEVSFSPGTWNNPADVETTCGYFHTSTKWNDIYKDGCHLIWNGGNWSLYSASKLSWPVVMKKSQTIFIGSGKPTSPEATSNNFAGLFTVESGVTLTVSDWSSGAGAVYFSGGIGGAGKVSVSLSNEQCFIGGVSGSATVANAGAGTLQIYGKMTDSANLSVSAGLVNITATDSDYTGKNSATGGKIRFAKAGSFPMNGYNAETVSSRLATSGSGRIELVVKCEDGDDGFESEDIKKILGPAAGAGISNFGIVVPEGKSFEYANDIDGSGYNKYFAADGTLTLSGSFSGGFVPDLSLIKGKLVMTNGYGETPSAEGLDTLAEGELDLGGDFQMNVAANHTKNLIVGSANKSAVFKMSGNARYVCDEHKSGHATQPLLSRIGSGENSRSIFEIDGNAYFSTKMQLASDSIGMVSSVYQRGGTVNTPKSSADMGWGNAGWSTPSQSFYELSGGTYQVGYWTRQAMAPNAIGMFYQHGGTVMLNSRFIPCIRGTGVVYQTSGIWNGTNGDQNDIGYGEWSSWAPGGFCNWTITGEGTKYTSSNLIRVGAHDGAIHIFNVNNGARLEATQFSAGKTNLNSRGILNFNGGAYAPSGASCLGNETNTGNGGQPEIYIYGGGMTFDTSRVTASDKVTTVNASFLAPTGKGVKSIAMPSELPEGYIAPPLVVIEGDGFGATAVAEFDSTNKVVTGITVTSPGCDYTTARAYLYGGGPKASNGYVECGAVALEDNVSGGLTKIGDGNLKLVNCEHTYTGVTYVAQGTLSTYGRNENKERILANTAVRIAKGAVLDLYWHASYVKAFGGAGICYNQGPTRTGELFYTKDEVADGGLTFSNTDVATAGATGRLELIANTVVKISDLDELDHSKTYPLVTCTASLTVDGGLTLEGGDAGRWRLVTDSKMLSLRPIGGMVILLK